MPAPRHVALFSGKYESEMLAQRAEIRQDQEAAATAAPLVVLERPRGGMGNEYGVQPRLECGIDIAAGTVANHPTVRFHDMVAVYQCAVRGRILFGDNFDRVEMNLQP